MDLTYNDLIKLPLTKLKELALSIGDIHGVHGMKKMQLIQAICEKKGIVDTSKEEAEKRRKAAHADIKKIKKQKIELQQERETKRSSMSRTELSEYRIRIKKLKQKTRKLAKT
ncbi:transcription termination factor Rho [bacterium]|nr:transcription termination factor Rho [candidate division CSSED10-310 bacterium]